MLFPVVDEIHILNSAPKALQTQGLFRARSGMDSYPALRQSARMPKKLPAKTEAILLANFMTVYLGFAAQHERAPMRRFAEKTGITENYVSQIVNGRKGVGMKIAGQVETAFKLGSGWMSVEHPDWEPRNVGHVIFLQTVVPQVWALGHEKTAEFTKELLALLARYK